MQLYNKINSIIKTHKLIFCFLLSSFIVLLIGLMLEPSPDKYVYDAEYYYHLATSFYKTGSFSLYNFDASFRGYLFPFILFLYIGIGALVGINPAICILIGNSLFVSFLFTLIIPKFFQAENEGNIVKTMVPLALFMLYWSDLVYYPLSDLYSYGTLLIAIWLLTIIDIKNLKKLILVSSLSGILLYASYNTRTIYVFLIPATIILFVSIHKKENNKNLLIALISIFLGVLICALPQISINNFRYNQKTMFVITDSLFDYQLYNGLYLQRYETYIGDMKDYPSAGMNFIDNVGNQIITKEKIVLDGNFNIFVYGKIIIKYPLEYIGIMARHFINIFHLPYNHVYIKNLNFYKTFFSIFNYTILYITGVGIVINRKKNGKKYINLRYIYLTLIPCIAIFPGAIEMRFFIPMYILIYCFLSFQISTSEMISFIRNNKIKIVISYLIILAMLIAVWGSTFSSLQFGPQFIG